MPTPKSRLTDLTAESNPKRVFVGYLSEDYDGIAQYVSVSLSKGSSSAALARVSVVGLSGRFPLEAGAPVAIVMVHGRLEITSLGG